MILLCIGFRFSVKHIALHHILFCLKMSKVHDMLKIRCIYCMNVSIIWLVIWCYILDCANTELLDCALSMIIQTWLRCITFLVPWSVSWSLIKKIYNFPGMLYKPTLEIWPQQTSVSSVSFTIFSYTCYHSTYTKQL